MFDPAEIKKYAPLENVLIRINQKHISLPENDKKRNSIILETLTNDIVKRMEEADTLFKTMYERTFYGGSYYDGLKVGKPEEYDLDFVLKLPAIVEPCVEVSNKHGFVHIKIQAYSKMEGRPEASRYPKLSRLMEDKYISTTKVLQWIESTITNAFTGFEKEDRKTYFDIRLNNQMTRLYLKLRKQHPAFTLNIKDKSGSIYLDIDLVTCFQFTDKDWPKGRYRKNPVPTKNKFLIVPKKPYVCDNRNIIHRYWRLSFQEQERDVLKGDKYRAVKPTMRLLKQLRDKYNHKIASYFIKTIILWEIEQQDISFWNLPLGFVFMKMLKVYETKLREKNIPYYWDSHYNLIDHLNETTTTQIANTINNMIIDVEKNLERPETILKYFVGPREVEQLMLELNLNRMV